MTKKIPGYVYLYRITYSEVPEYPVGNDVVHPGRELFKAWTFYETGKGTTSEFGGVRGFRACPTCYAEHRLVREFAHEHAHGEGDETAVGRMVVAAAEDALSTLAANR